MDFFDALVRYETYLWNHLDDRLVAAGGVSLANLTALRVVRRHAGSARVQELRTHLGITVGAASKLVDRLERDGLVVRTANPHDRRSSLITLTPAGDAAHDAGVALVDSELAAHLAGEDVTERDRPPDAPPRPAHDGGGPMTAATMRAVVVDRPGGPEVLQVRDVPVPRVEPGQVLIRVHAFGLNRSELHFRRGQASSGSFPRIPGIEAAGVVEDAPGGELAPGTQVVTLMGGMGRTFDGGYAQYVAVPAAQVIPFTSDLPWDVLGAVPEMLQTAHGTLAVGVRPSAGQSLLIRGGTSSVGLTLAVLGAAAAA